MSLTYINDVRHVKPLWMSLYSKARCTGNAQEPILEAARQKDAWANVEELAELSGLTSLLWRMPLVQRRTCWSPAGSDNCSAFW